MSPPGVGGDGRPFLADEPVGIHLIATRLGMNNLTVASRRARGNFPKERGHLTSRTPWWYWQADIVPWAVAAGLLRPAEED